MKKQILALGNRTENGVPESTNRPNKPPKGYLENFILYLIITNNVVFKTILRSKAFSFACKSKSSELVGVFQAHILSTVFHMMV